MVPNSLVQRETDVRAEAHKETLVSPTHSHASKDGSQPQSEMLHCFSAGRVRWWPFVLQWRCVRHAKHTHTRACTRAHTHTHTHTHTPLNQWSATSLELQQVEKMRQARIRDFSSSQPSPNTLSVVPSLVGFLPGEMVKVEKRKVNSKQWVSSKPLLSNRSTCSSRLGLHLLRDETRGLATSHF